MYFKGDIIVTDPCYLLTSDSYNASHYGKNLGMFGFTTYLVADTGFGDWCNVVYCNGEEHVFCADSGQVCVVLKDEYLKYTKEHNTKNENLLTGTCAAVLKDFDGEVEIDTTCSVWTVVRGNGNYSFHSEEVTEERWEEEKDWKRQQAEWQAQRKAQEEQMEKRMQEYLKKFGITEELMEE